MAHPKQQTFENAAARLQDKVETMLWCAGTDIANAKKATREAIQILARVLEQL